MTQNDMPGLKLPSLSSVNSNKLGVGWRKTSVENSIMQMAGYVEGYNDEQILSALRSVLPEQTEIKKLANHFRGHFGILYQDDCKSIAITDCVASYPIFYKKCGRDYKLASSAQLLTFGEEVDNRQAKAVLQSGYTIGQKTCYRGVSILGHGQIFLHHRNSSCSFSHYFKFNPWQKPLSSCRVKLKNTLSELTLDIMSRVMEQAGSRTIAVPLSAGVDSRLIASSLKHLGAENVLCYSYGLKGNFEAKTAKSIADRLGYNWTFIELSPRIQKKFWETGIPQDFASETNDFVAAPVHHDLYVTNELLNKGVINSDTLIVNGNSGDFISGNHIPETLFDKHNHETGSDLNKVVDLLMQKHFGMWKTKDQSEYLADVEELLTSELATLSKNDSQQSIASLYEYFEMTNRQIKWVIKRQRIYDFYSLPWALPLWDLEYLKFWEKISLKDKQNQNLYVETLNEKNWGNVWSDIPGNSSRFVSPNWMRFFLRPLMKTVCAPFGKSFWHQFENRFLDYWLDEFGLYGPFSYSSVILEKQRPRNCLAFHIREYVRGLNIEADNPVIK